MTNLEKKIDVLLRAIAGEDEETRQKAVEDARNLCREPADNVDDTIRLCTEDLLMELIPCSIRGFEALVEGIVLVVKNPYIINAITKELYPQVAKNLGDNRTPSKVERAMRHAIGLCVDRCDITTYCRYFGNTTSLKSGTPTNSEFIARMAKEVSRRI